MAQEKKQSRIEREEKKEAQRPSARARQSKLRQNRKDTMVRLELWIDKETEAKLFGLLRDLNKPHKNKYAAELLTAAVNNRHQDINLG